MYIDEIKKLLKEIEKSVRGDKRWIENEDYNIKDKLEILLKDTNTFKKSQNHENVIMVGNYFHNEYKKKLNVKSSNDIIIKLPSNLMHSTENIKNPQKNRNLETSLPLQITTSLPLETTNDESCPISMERLDKLENAMRNVSLLSDKILK